MTRSLELLESRRLLTSLTFITHGYNSDTTGWVSTAANYVQTRDGGAKASSVYTMKVKSRSGDLAVTGFAPDAGQRDWQKTTKGDLILKLDWGSVSTGSYTTQDVAAVVDDYFQSAHGTVPALAGLPMHLIGHSRGASLMTALAQDLGQSGIWVDQQTNLDPHPVDGHNDVFGVDFGDRAMHTYDNVVFADTYWRTDGDANNFDFDGEPVAGSYNSELTSVQSNFIASAHSAVTAYYNGTIDTSTYDGGDEPILPGWYQGTKAAPARTATGYAYNEIAGSALPSSGVDAAIGGRGQRTTAGQSGGQWANAFGLNTRRVTSVQAGGALTAQFYTADRDSKLRVDVYVDGDANPYDGATLVTGKTFAAGTLGSGRVGVPTAGLAAGKYYLAARATDAAGHLRWDYTPYQVAVTTPTFAKLSGGALTVSGTARDDVIGVSQRDGTLTLTLNGLTQTFSTTGIHSITVNGGSGNDAIDASRLAEDVLINGGPGGDRMVGGAGDDTLIGQSGRDFLNGGGGRNTTDTDARDARTNIQVLT